MKNKKKLSAVFFALACSLCVGGALSAQDGNVQADAATTLGTGDNAVETSVSFVGATIRIGTKTDENGYEGYGLRFAGAIPVGTYNKLEQIDDADDGVSVDYGMLIVPKDKMTIDGTFVDLNEDSVFGAGASYEILADDATSDTTASGKVGVMNIVSAKLSETDEVQDEEGTVTTAAQNYHILGSITDMPQANLTREYVGKAYVKYTDETGTSYAFADEYTAANIDTYSRSYAYVAVEAVNDEDVATEHKTWINDLLAANPNNYYYNVTYKYLDSEGNEVSTKVQEKAGSAKLNGAITLNMADYQDEEGYLPVETYAENNRPNGKTEAWVKFKPAGTISGTLANIPSDVSATDIVVKDKATGETLATLDENGNYTTEKLLYDTYDLYFAVGNVKEQSADDPYGGAYEGLINDVTVGTATTTANLDKLYQAAGFGGNGAASASFELTDNGEYTLGATNNGNNYAALYFGRTTGDFMITTTVEPSSTSAEIGALLWGEYDGQEDFEMLVRMVPSSATNMNVSLYNWDQRCYGMYNNGWLGQTSANNTAGVNVKGNVLNYNVTNYTYTLVRKDSALHLYINGIHWKTWSGTLTNTEEANGTTYNGSFELSKLTKVNVGLAIRGTDTSVVYSDYEYSEDSTRIDNYLANHKLSASENATNNSVGTGVWTVSEDGTVTATANANAGICKSAFLADTAYDDFVFETTAKPSGNGVEMGVGLFGKYNGSPQHLMIQIVMYNNDFITRMCDDWAGSKAGFFGETTHNYTDTIKNPANTPNGYKIKVAKEGSYFCVYVNDTFITGWDGTYTGNGSGSFTSSLFSNVEGVGFTTRGTGSAVFSNYSFSSDAADVKEAVGSTVSGTVTCETTSGTVTATNAATGASVSGTVTDGAYSLAHVTNGTWNLYFDCGNYEGLLNVTVASANVTNQDLTLYTKMIIPTGSFVGSNNYGNAGDWSMTGNGEYTVSANINDGGAWSGAHLANTEAGTGDFVITSNVTIQNVHTQFGVALYGVYESKNIPLLIIFRANSNGGYFAGLYDDWYSAGWNMGWIGTNTDTSSSEGLSFTKTDKEFVLKVVRQQDSIKLYINGMLMKEWAGSLATSGTSLRSTFNAKDYNVTKVGLLTRGTVGAATFSKYSYSTDVSAN